ncbi:MAG: DUF4142 domain-containing protein [Salinarimonas sp.]
MTPIRSLALASALLALFAPLVLAAPPPAAAQDGLDPGEARALDAAPFTPEEAAQRYAPRTALDWQALEELDAPTYVGRLAALDRLAMSASKLVLSRDPRLRTTNVARDILEAHEAGRAIAETTLPEGAGSDPLVMEDDEATLAALEAEARSIAFEERYVDAMIEAHREAIALTSFYRRFGADEQVREFSRRVLPMLEASLYQAVTIRQELVAEFVAARGEGEGEGEGE